MMLTRCSEQCSTQCPGHAPSNARRNAHPMLGAMHATNATNATNERPPRPAENRRVSYPPKPQKTEVSEVTAHDMARVSRVLDQQEAWNLTIGLTSRWYTFPDWPTAADWYATIPRQPLTGQALIDWVAYQWVRSGHPIITPDRQLQIALNTTTTRNREPAAA